MYIDEMDMDEMDMDEMDMDENGTWMRKFKTDNSCVMTLFKFSQWKENQ